MTKEEQINLVFEKIFLDTQENTLQYIFDNIEIDLKSEENKIYLAVLKRYINDMHDFVGNFIQIE